MKKSRISSSFKNEEDCLSSSADENWDNRLYISECKGLTCNKLLRLNRSQAGIIVAILLILIVIGSVVVVWTIVSSSVKKSTQQASGEPLNIKLDVNQVKFLYNGSVEVDLSRGADNGGLTELRFIFYNKKGANKIISRTGNLSQKTSKVFLFSPSEIGYSLNEIDKVSVVPVFGDNLGIPVDEPKPKEDENRIRQVYLYDDLVIPNGSLISWWKFDDGDGRDYIDGNTGTLQNGALTTGNVLNLDGVDDSVNIGTPVNLELSGNFLKNTISISAWVKTLDMDAFNCLVKRGANSQNHVSQEYSLHLESGIVLLIFGDGTAISSDLSGGFVGDNKWHMITGILRKNNITEIYIDGILKNQSIKSVTWPFGPFDGWFGRCRSQNTYMLNGKLDDIMIFSTDLTATQIKNLYLNQNKTSRP